MNVSENQDDQSQNRHRSRIDQVIDAAAACSVRKGFHATSISMLANEAGMSVGHIYHYFANKSAIVCALVRRELDEANKSVAELEALEGEEILDHMKANIREALMKHSDPFKSLLYQEIHAEAFRNDEVALILREFDTQFRRKFQKIFEEKLGLPDARERVEMLFAFFHGLPSRRFRNPDAYPDQMLSAINRMLTFLVTPSETVPPKE